MNSVKTIPIPKPHHIPFIVIALAMLVLSVGLVLTLLQKRAPATTGDIYLEKTKVAAKEGEEVRFVAMINPGAPIDTVTTTARFDEANLKYQKTEYTQSPFASQIPATMAGNQITVQSAKLGGNTVNASSLIATLVFTALKSGTHTIDLMYGNAARAGVATHPTIMGKVVEDPLLTNKSQTSGKGALEESSPLTFAAAPLVGMLKSAGVSSDAAKRVAPWLFGLGVCIILAGITGTILYVRRKHKTTPARGVDV